MLKCSFSPFNNDFVGHPDVTIQIFIPKKICIVCWVLNHDVAMIIGNEESALSGFCCC